MKILITTDLFITDTNGVVTSAKSERSNLTHILGGVVGSVSGYFLNKKKYPTSLSI